MPRINVGLALSYVKLLLSSWKTYNYVQFEGMVYQQIVKISMGTNCELFQSCYERDFMSNLHKSKQYNLIDIFNDTSRYLDDIFTIDNSQFEKHISDIFPTELQLNKENTSDKETSFLDLNIKVIGSDVHTAVYDKRDDFGFSNVNFPWFSGDVPRLQPNGVYISEVIRFARCCTIASDSHSKKYSNHFQTTNTGLQISHASKYLESSSVHTLIFYLNLVKYRFRNIFRKESLNRSSTMIYSTNKCEANFVSFGSKIVNAFDVESMTIDHREDYRSCAWSIDSLVHIIPSALQSHLQGGWDYMTGLVQTSSEATRSWSPLIGSRDSFSL